MNRARQQRGAAPPGYSKTDVGNYLRSIALIVRDLKTEGAAVAPSEQVGSVLARNKISLGQILNRQMPRMPMPEPEILSRYQRADALPPPSATNPLAGTRNYGSVTVHGGSGAWAAYEGVRRYGTANPRGRQVIALIENNPSRRVHVYPYDLRQNVDASPWTDFHENGIDIFVKFGVNQGGVGANGALLPPAAVALHELQHATDAPYVLELIEISLGNYDTLAEWRAIDGPDSAEAEAQEARGMPRRDDHEFSYSYRTTGPESVTAAKPAVAGKLNEAIPWLRYVTSLLQHYGVDQANPPDWVGPLPKADEIRNGAQAQHFRTVTMQQLIHDIANLEGRTAPRTARR